MESCLISQCREMRKKEGHLYSNILLKGDTFSPWKENMQIYVGICMFEFSRYKKYLSEYQLSMRSFKSTTEPCEYKEWIACKNVNDKCPWNIAAARCLCYLKLRHIAVTLYGEVFSQQQYNQKAEAAKTSLIKKTSFTCLTKASWTWSSRILCTLTDRSNDF